MTRNLMTWKGCLIGCKGKRSKEQRMLWFDDHRRKAPFQSNFSAQLLVERSLDKLGVETLHDDESELFHLGSSLV